MPRRTFLASGMLLGNTLFGMPLSWESSTQTSPKAKETLSADEKKWIDGSELAKEIQDYFGQGFSCAESIFMVSLRYLKKPEEWVWAAAGFGGGLYNQDLCGFLTGGIMGLGCASGMLDMPRKEGKKFCGGWVKEYWNWWKMQAPLHCARIRTDETTSAVCKNLGLLSAAKIEEFFEKIKDKV